MRFLILIALCLAVATASYTNRNRFNRLLRNMQNGQQQQNQYESQGLSNEQDYDQDDDDQNDDQDDDYNQQKQQCNRQGNNMNLEDDDEQSNCGQDQDDDEQDEGTCQGRQCRQQQQRRRQQQQQYGQQNEQQWGQQNQQQFGQQNQQKRHQCQPKPQLLQELEEPNCKLAAKLYKQAKQENDDKNTVVSPTAVQLALAAIQRGARGQTKRQLQRLLAPQLSQKQQQQACAALQQTLQGQQQGQQGQRHQQQRGQQNQQAQVKTTTTIIVNQQNRAQNKFIQAVKACVNAQVKQCNFQRQPQQCRQQINQYIAQKTNQKLQHVVPQEAVTENTKMIVVNTAQLKAKWGQQFRQQQQTKQGRFHPLGSQQSKQCQVIKTQGQFDYYEDDQLQVVGVPTQRQELTLFVIVPKDKDGLNEIEKQQIQNGQQLKQLLDQAEQQQQQIDLELPKFQIKHKIDAKQTLRQQGAKAPFDADQADLSGINGQQGQQQNRRRQQQMTDDEDDQQSQYGQDEQDEQGQQGQQLHVNKLIHQCTIKIDEQGISAARPGRQQQHHQYQQQDQDDEQNNEDDEDQQDQYEQNQFTRQQTYQNIFGNQRRHRRNQNQQGERKVKVNRAFAFAIKHNPSNQIVMVGRVVDATQKPKQQQQQGRQQQSLNGVDQQ